MKRVFALLLCIAMLFAIGCQKEDAAPEPPAHQAPQTPPEGEWGEFYTEDGYVQNTLITAVMNTTDLRAPVTELSYSICENTSFGVGVTYYTEGNDYRRHRLEIYRDGVWKEAPTSGSRMTELAMRPAKDPDPMAHRKHDFTMELAHVGHYALVQYDPLEKGDYRLIVTYELSTDRTDIDLLTVETAAILYFTVT